MSLSTVEASELDALVAVVERKAEERKADILRAAREETARIRHTAAQGFEQRLEERLEGQRRALLEACRDEVAKARREAQREVLMARARMLDEVYERAKEKLRASPELALDSQRIAGELAEALRYFEGEAVVIECPPALTDPIARLTSDRPRTQVVPSSEVSTGFLARTTDGRLTVDGTLEAALERRWPDLAIEALRRLDGER